MAKYDIYVEETYLKEYIVEANSPEEAFRKLHDDFLTGKRKRPDVLETSKMGLEFIVPEEQDIAISMTEEEARKFIVGEKE